VPFDEIVKKDGNMMLELTVVLGVPNHSPSEDFLGRSRDIIYARLDP
jgi:hypothetical protein